jgi:predicted transglutaminase-like cysteine proteinase
MQALQLGLSAASGITGFMGMQAQASAAQQTARNNQIMAGYAAADAQRRGEEEAQAVQRKASQLRGTQRSMMAARGLDLSVGTPTELIDQTDFFGEQDAATARMNARRESWAIRADAANQSAAARADASRLRSSSYGSLLGSAASVADKWMTYRPSGPSGLDPSGMLFSPTGAAIRARR